MWAALWRNCFTGRFHWPPNRDFEILAPLAHICTILYLGMGKPWATNSNVHETLPGHSNVHAQPR